MSASTDLVGQVFGKLVVVGKTSARKRQAVVWELMCECGTLCYSTSSSLKRGWKKSCGCIRRALMTEKPIRLKHGKAKTPLYLLWTSASHRAKAKGMEFSIDFEDLVVPDVCPVLGIPLQHSQGKHKDGSPSLDRLDNSKGYTKENTWIISRRANVLKNDASLEELELIVKALKAKLQEI